jgi:hypothetical protein
MATMRFGGKVSDMFWLLTDGIDYDGYVPYGLGIGGSDYLELKVDIETGQILNWKPLTLDQISLACYPDRDDEFEEEEE